MGDDVSPEFGAGSCVRCRALLPPDTVVCPSCPPVEPQAPPPGSPVDSPFVLAMTVGLLLLFLLFYSPRRLGEERGKPLPTKSRFFGGRVEEWQKYGAELRGSYLPGSSAGQELSLEQLRDVLEQRLREIDRDPRYSREERAQIREALEGALGGTGD